MTTLTLGKIKFVNRGTWSSSATYSQGDVVQYNGQSYIYKNETPKSYTALLFGPQSGFPITGTISSMAAQSDTFTVTYDSALPSINDSRIVANSDIFAHASFLEPDCKIISITNLSTTQSTITVSKRNTSTSTVSGPVSIGPRRVANQYEVALNKTDWDLLSEGMTYAGEWSRTANYTDGQIVVRNGNSYLCTGGNYGVDPLFDYIGVWEPFLIGHDAYPHERIVCGVNKNPFNWRGHPYIKKPTWSNVSTVSVGSMTPGTTYTIVSLGNTDFTYYGAAINAVGVQFVMNSNLGNGTTGTVASAYSGIPWNIPSSHKDAGTNSLAAWTWAWNTPHMPAQMKYRGSLSVGSDGRGHRIGKGHMYYGTGGPGQLDTYRLFAGEEAAQYFNDYYTDENPHYGNKPFSENFRKSQAPRLMQNNAQWTTNASLTSNGTVIVAGTSSGSSLGTGEDADYSSAYIELDKSRFGNRAIVKLGGGTSNSRNSNVWYAALDEFGELWMWGNNGYGQCGIGPENHLASGYRVANRTDNVRTPMCLPKEIFFEGNRIVDVFTQENSIHALDEAGNLWGWGRNNYGQLGYSTASFATATQSAAPFKIPVNWATYGGIQKVMTPSAENAEWIMVLDGQGHVWTQGNNDAGQLGTNNTTSDSNTTGTLRRTSSTAGWSIGGGIKNIWATTGGCQLSFFLDTSLQLWACGNGGNYNFGASSTANRLTPAQMFGPKGAMTDIVCISGSGRSGANTQIALDKDGITYGCGWNQYGEAGVGHTSVVGNNYTYHQQNGTSATSAGWARCFMASNYYEPGNRVVDIWGYGDYDATVGHVTANFWLTERGEILLCGRDYNYSVNGQGEPQTAPFPVTNFA